VIDDTHELGPEARRQLELLIMRAPPQLRFVLASRHEVRLGLHRLRLEGEVAEIRGPDLLFTLAEAEELFAAAGVALPGLAALVERTEGWAAGLRLAALSLAGHPDPERLAAEFSGTERTVAEYLLAEVLDQQPEPVRRLLLRTSILEQVNGELADLLTGDGGGERILQDLEAANAFVTAVNAGRSWFRYHHLFADLLQLELRRTGPGDAELHRTAAGWLAERGLAVEAVRHAQAAQDWGLAARVLADHWPSLYLDGHSATVHELLAGFPEKARAGDAELAAVTAGDELARGSLEAAEVHLGLAEREVASLPDVRQRKALLLIGIVRLLHARQRGNLPTLAEEARRVQAIADAPEAQPGLGEDLRALALISLGSTEFWVARFVEAERHLDQGVALARRIGRPYLEFTGLVYAANLEFFRSFAVAVENSMQAAELAELNGWSDEPAAGLACVSVGGILVWQGRPDEAEPWMQRADRTLRAEAEPADGLLIVSMRGLLELARGQNAGALASFEAAARLAARLAEPNLMVHGNRSFLVQTLVRLDEIERAEQVLAALADQDRDGGAMRISLATLRLAQGDPEAAVAALAPVLDGSAPLPWPAWLSQGFLLDAIAREALGDPGAAATALERALDLAEPDGVLLPFLLHPAPELLERQSRLGTAHASLISEILNLQAGQTPAPRPEDVEPLQEPLSERELRVLRYLPTNLRAPEIAAELFVSLNTIRSHMRHVYTKLGVHSRGDAVERARALGLLAPSSRTR
jgi:LuxR family transcriptional regulator, maltose regulon positive regulatory protein